MMYQAHVGPTVSLVEQQSTSHFSQHSYGGAMGENAIFGSAAGQDLSQRKGMNRQMADFNISAKVVGNNFKVQQSGIVPFQATNLAPQCELHPLDDNRSEYSVRTHSHFG